MMDGQGNLVGAITSNADGVVLRRPLVGTYIVEADCTGSIAIDFTDALDGHATFDMVVDDDGNEFRTVSTPPPGAVNPPTLTAVFRKKRNSKPRWHATARRSLSGTESRFFRISVLSLAPQQDAATKWSSRSLSRSPSLVLDEFRRLGRIYPWRLIVI